MSLIFNKHPGFQAFFIVIINTMLIFTYHSKSALKEYKKLDRHVIMGSQIWVSVICSYVKRNNLPFYIASLLIKKRLFLIHPVDY